MFYLSLDICSVLPKAKMLPGGKGFAPSGQHISNNNAKVRESIKVIYLLGMIFSVVKVFNDIY